MSFTFSKFIFLIAGQYVNLNYSTLLFVSPFSEVD